MKTVKKLLCLTILFLCFCQPSAFCQSPDKIFVHFDRSVYVTGERVWYKAYFLNGKPILSKVLYLEILNDEGVLLASQKLSVSENTAQGDILIPYDWKEGYYRFRFYTQWNRNFNSGFIYHRDIPIYNIWGEKPNFDTTVTTINNRAVSPRTYEKIQIELNKTEYSRRDDVLVTIKNNSDQLLNLSASVFIHGLINRSWSIIEQNSNYQSIDQKKLWDEFKPENGLFITGRLKVPTSGELLNTPLLSIFSVEDHRFYRNSSVNGVFELELPDFYGQRTLQIQNLHPAGTLLPELLLEDHPLNTSISINKELPKSRDILEYLIRTRKKRELNEIFQIQTKRYFTDQPEKIALKPDRVFYMKDYRLVEDLAEFITELFFKTVIKKENGTSTVRLYDRKNTRLFPARPWYFLNGYMVYDESKILELPTDEIERVELFNNRNSVREQFEPLMARSGVIAVYTIDDEPLENIGTTINQTTLQGFNKPNKFGQSQPQEEEKIPDFRAMLYWNPEIKIQANSSQTVTFKTSDALGNFKIIVQGVDGLGQPVYGEALLNIQHSLE